MAVDSAVKNAFTPKGGVLHASINEGDPILANTVASVLPGLGWCRNATSVPASKV